MGHRTGVWSSAPRFLILFCLVAFPLVLVAKDLDLGGKTALSRLCWRQKNVLIQKIFPEHFTFLPISANPIGARRGPPGVAATGPGEGEEEAGRGREETEGGKSHFVAEGRERGCVIAISLSSV